MSIELPLRPPPAWRSQWSMGAWEGTHVTDMAQRVSVREIRAAWGDAADAPQSLATVGRQGYRFLVGDDREVPRRCWNP